MTIESTDLQRARPDLGAAVEIENVSKKFRVFSDRRTNLKENILSFKRRTQSNDFWALKDVSFSIPKGQTTGLIGHNGSGKSTLLKLVAGIHRPTDGSITTHGRISAMLELGAGFHPELSGRENVYLNGSILGMTRRQIDQAMESIIDFSGLREFIDTPVKVYSSGMYVRLGFAIAVNLDPEILIIDEVIAVGDEEFQRRCFDHLYELRRKGVTIVLVSHGLGLIQSICDNVAWMDHGHLRSFGEAGQVVQEYLNEVNEREADSAQTVGGTEGDDKRPGSKEISIKRLELLDANLSPVAFALAGEPLRVRYHYSISAPVTDPVFGLGVYTENDTYVNGSHNRQQDLKIGTLTGDGHVDLVMDQLRLNPGTYRITSAVTDWSLAHQYDLRDRDFELKVRPGTAFDYHGLANIGADWQAGAASE